MHAIILAAGYATRLSPLTDHCPKPLLPIRGVPLLDYVMAKLFTVKEVSDVTLVSNHKFIGHFENWLRWRRAPVSVRLLDDGSVNNELRLGAIRDLQFAIDRGAIADDVLVLAADNLFAADLSQMIAFANERWANCVIARRLDDLAARQRTGIATLDADNRVLELQEKPHVPKSHWAVPPLYVFRRETLKLIGDYLREGNTPDSPGNFVAWLCTRRPVFAWRCDAEVFDIGNIEQYGHVQAVFDAGKQAAFGIKPW
jgi:glucose-1-phosphate thymidylyltransferase